MVRWPVSQAHGEARNAADDSDNSLHLTGVEFRLGYNHVVGGVDRLTLWQQREGLVGKLVKFKHQPSGAKEAPRFPKFIGFRETWDLS